MVVDAFEAGGRVGTYVREEGEGRKATVGCVKLLRDIFSDTVASQPLTAPALYILLPAHPAPPPHELALIGRGICSARPT